MNSIGQILGKGAAYRQLLQTDEWKAFSKDVRENYGSCCRVCKRRNVPTQVHHLFYDPSRMPWEYKAEEVVLLCQDCHEAMHEHLQNFRRFVFGKLSPRTFQILNGALSVGLDHNDPLELCHAIANMCASPNSVKRFALDWNKTTGLEEMKFPPSDYPTWEPPIEGRSLPPKIYHTAKKNIPVVVAKTGAQRSSGSRSKYGGLGWGFHGLGRRHYDLRLNLERQRIARERGELCQENPASDPAYRPRVV